MEGGGRRGGPRGRRGGGRPGGRGPPRAARGPRRESGERPSPPVVEDTELGSRTLEVESKKFLFSVKENTRGKFLKISELNEAGSMVGRNKVTLALSTGPSFVEMLTEFSEFNASQGADEAVPEDGRIKSSTLQKDPKRYYFDLKQNDRGRFLRICQTTTMGGRQQVAFPADAMVSFRDSLKDLLDEQGTDDGNSSQQLPESRDLRVNRKRFYFDVGSNERGVFLRISEVTNRYRSSITVPQSGWESLRDALNDYAQQLPYTETEADQSEASLEPASSEA